MSKENPTKLWKWLSLGCFADVIGSLISIQGGVFRARASVSAVRAGACLSALECSCRFFIVC